MGSDTLLVHFNTWSTSSTTTSAGKSNSDDLVNELLTTLNDFVNEMSPIFFLNSMQNLMTAVEDFGQGMSAALACVSVDLQVVSSGLSSAAVAFAATDKTLAHTFAQLDTQLGYYTHTTTSTALPKPTPAHEAALNTAYQQYYSSGSNTGNGLHLSQQQIQNAQTNNSNAAATTGVGIVTVLLIVGICLI
jgi:hypothetical protein